MTCTLHVAWDERLTDYHFGPGHPLAPVRVELTMQLAHEFGLWSQPGVTVAAPVPAADADLELVHDARYIAAVRSASHWAEHPDASGDLQETRLRHARAFGLGTRDQPAFPSMHQASALVAGATLAAARAIWSGSAEHGASIAGGMHHAMAARASGFGVYNDAAVAIAWLLGHGAERIAYVDIDAHHGDGVQAAFYADPRVLTISVHQHPADMFPFTGLPAETGGPGAEGSAVNVALPAGTGDADWL
jgi:acetoin utilization protein AcuC